MITLRPAHASDAHRLRAWRNDPATRASAMSTSEVEEAEHEAWLAAKLADDACVIWIAEHGAIPVGQVRLDRIDAVRAEVDLTVAPEVRRRGVAVSMLEAAAAEAPSELGVTTLLARVRRENEPSLRAFERAGFARVRSHGELVELERWLHHELSDGDAQSP